MASYLQGAWGNDAPVEPWSQESNGKYPLACHTDS